MSPVRATASAVIACGIAILGSVLAVLACLIRFVDTLMLRATPEGQQPAAFGRTFTMVIFGDNAGDRGVWRARGCRCDQAQEMARISVPVWSGATVGLCSLSVLVTMLVLCRSPATKQFLNKISHQIPTPMGIE